MRSLYQVNIPKRKILAKVIVEFQMMNRMMCRAVYPRMADKVRPVMYHYGPKHYKNVKEEICIRIEWHDEGKNVNRQ